MSSYRSDGIRYFRIAQQMVKDVDADHKLAFVSIVFSALYLESAVNDIVFQTQIEANLANDVLPTLTTASSQLFKMIKSEIDLDLYDEKASFSVKLSKVLNTLGRGNNQNALCYIELDHLMQIRGSLAHLKLVEQEKDGAPKKRLCRGALNYLNKCKKIIDDPYAEGVFWTDVLMNKTVAEWAVEVAKNSIECHCEQTDDGQLGNAVLLWHCNLLGVGRFRDL